jgi:hypothetical protein
MPLKIKCNLSDYSGNKSVNLFLICNLTNDYRLGKDIISNH